MISQACSLNLLHEQFMISLCRMMAFSGESLPVGLQKYFGHATLNETPLLAPSRGWRLFSNQNLGESCIDKAYSSLRQLIHGAIGSLGVVHF
jgi:hypothetical protein